MKYKSEFKLDDIVYFKLRGALTRVFIVKAIIFEREAITINCRNANGDVFNFREHELMHQSDYDAMRGHSTKSLLASVDDEANYSKDSAVSDE